MVKRYHLAIDTGGSKTLFVVYDETDTAVFKTQTQGFGAAVDSDEPLPVLEEALMRIRDAYSIGNIAVNVGGKNLSQIEAVVRHCFPKSAVATFRESQGCAALGFGRKHHANIVLLAGTGVIGIGEYNGKVCIADGWGANIGDAGSGYAIGLDTIQTCLKELDGTEALSAITKEITGREEPIGALTDANEICAARDQVRAKIGVMDRRNIASYAKVSAKHAAAGDRTCIARLEESGAQMAELVIKVAKKLGITEPTNVAVLGGLANTASYWAEKFEAVVQDSLSIETFLYDPDGVIKGTLLYGQQLLES